MCRIVGLRSPLRPGIADNSLGGWIRREEGKHIIRKARERGRQNKARERERERVQEREVEKGRRADNQRPSETLKGRVRDGQLERAREYERDRCRERGERREERGEITNFEASPRNKPD